MTSLRALTNALLTTLIAPPCAACARLLDAPLDGAVCETCWASIVCTSARFSLPAIPNAGAIGPYDGTLREILHAFKYDGRRSAAARLSRMMAEHGRDILTGAHAVVPVPLHKRRYRARGFNQAADLASGLGIPVWHALCRVRDTHSQVDLPADRRHQNVTAAFSLAGSGFGLATLLCRARPPIEGSTLVLVDDVTTTGATLEACARALTRARVREVRALTVARVVSAPR